ncbi:hypothetical protein BBP40_011477 [Aspergillus hancockii]|nr:hypothetical protein BBP40_011477 [Aspergillus hancockii]
MAQHQPSRRVLDWVDQQRTDPDQLQTEEEDTTSGARGRPPFYRGSSHTVDSPGDDLSTDSGDPEDVPLPTSGAGSSVTSDGREPRDEHGRNEEAARSSLEMVSRSGGLATAQLALVPRARPPSPKRRTTQRPTPVKPRRRKETSRVYKEVLDRAAKAFPHIRNGKARKRSRIEHFSISYYDVYDDHIAEAVTLDSSSITPSIREIPVPEGVQERVFLVEDLSQRAIHVLGEAFNVTPEFFEEHLLNSGYTGAQYNDPPARTWKTAGLTKTYASIQWFRPMYRLPPHLSGLDLEDLLKGRLGFPLGKSEYELEARTNIFRPEWVLQTDPGRKLEIEMTETWTDQVEEDEYMSDSNDTEDEGAQRTGTPQGDDPFEEGDLAQFFEIPIEPPRRESARPPLMPAWLLKIANRLADGSEISAQERHSRTTAQVLVKQMAPRTTITTDLEQALVNGVDMDFLVQELDNTRSTCAVVHDMLARHDQSANLVGTLFEIIRQDTSTLLKFLHQVLSDMETDIIDDIKMEDRLVLWRQLITRAQRELVELKFSIKTFLGFFDAPHPINISLHVTESGPTMMENALNLSQEMDQMLGRLQDTSASLTSNMGLLDSRRSIEEAHAVSRLTELAFIFIPLSFSTSVFGMQVQSFANPAPLWKFFVVAVVVTTFAYLMRLTMRSQWLANSKMKVKADVRQYAEQHGYAVQVRSLSILLLLQWFGSATKQRTRMALEWAVSRGRVAWMRLRTNEASPIRLLLAVLSAAGIAAIPIAILWSGNLDRGVQGAVTPVIVLVVLAIVIVPCWWKSRRSHGNPSPNTHSFLKRLAAWVAHPSLLLVAGVAIVATALALIWTHPLAAGIKAGLTTAILVIVVVGAAMLLLGALYSLRPAARDPEEEEAMQMPHTLWH